MIIIASNFYIMIAKIITKLKEVIDGIYIQDYMRGTTLFQEVLADIMNLPEYKTELRDSGSQLNGVISCILNSLENGDMLLFSDYIGEGLIPLLEERIVIKEPIVKKDYIIETTSSGYSTIKDTKRNIYLHCNSDPMREAKLMVEKVYEADKIAYIVWGMGLGYHVAQLVDISMGSVDILVYDDKRDILKYAEEYGAAGEIKDKFTFIYDPKGKEFVKAIGKHGTGILLHYPSIKTIENQAWKTSLEKLYMGWNGTIQFRRNLEINFRKNQRQIHNNVDQLLKIIEGKEIYLVAAGPSLDDNIEILKNKKTDSLVITVTTVLKKIYELGIDIDYTVVMDPQKRTLKQIEGLENCKVPMILGSTSYWEFSEKYKGEKYISYQKDYELAEEEAKRNGYNIYKTGGSVTTLALSTLLKLGAKRINLLGVDMAYSEGKSHACSTMDYKKVNTDGMERIPSVSGRMVYTEKKLLSYLRWIENEIACYSHIKVYNYSKTGAYIKGTYNPETDIMY